MNYQWHYDRLMERARTRELTGYAERHHVVPRCLGGSNSKVNLVRLTPEEHYVAHQLLAKMHPESLALARAAVLMSGKPRQMGRGNKLHGWLRRHFGRLSPGRAPGTKVGPISEETRAKIRAARLGQSTGKGRVFSAEHRAKISEAAKARRWTEEQKKLRGLANTGKTRSPETKQKMRDAWVLRKQRALTA